jgi:membrane-associated phospholipid phosphatase
MPFIIAVGLLISLVCIRGIRELFAVVFFLLQGALMQILKSAISQPRPTSSCLTSCGMPSGHTLLCIAYFIWFALEIVGRKENISIGGKTRWLLIAGIALLPVGWSRVVLGDHSWSQVFVGAFVGLASGGLWWCLLKQRCTYWLIKLITAHIPFLEKNYPPDAAEEELPWAHAGAGVPVADMSNGQKTPTDYGGTTR